MLQLSMNLSVSPRAAFVVRRLPKRQRAGALQELAQLPRANELRQVVECGSPLPLCVRRGDGVQWSQRASFLEVETFHEPYRNRGSLAPCSPPVDGLRAGEPALLVHGSNAHF